MVCRSRCKFLLAVLYHERERLWQFTQYGGSARGTSHRRRYCHARTPKRSSCRRRNDALEDARRLLERQLRDSQVAAAA